MRLWLSLAIILLLLSGCSSRRGAIKHNKVQAKTIQQQKLYIEKLKSIITKQHKDYQIERKKIHQEQMKKTSETLPTKIGNVVQAPKKEIQLKKVEDNNYNADYMYPGAKKKPTPTPKVQTTPTVATKIKKGMSKTECISLIGQVKFDKYTQMFGSEEASLKRCKILKTMQN
ncbi:MAG: Unknown protein [uncultured Sulfurovum sp.]|uniref:Lipoprotein n=1 Tax=uncultured Sulfurovum sp. TaxID=269237 RepID=A0A6S6SH69_9BACT|nr:MAG: Unknown protein [uncultured Sulfurovum sp.]